jgi:beta-lactamase regulating signal transducer with metallopeptidase domain
MGGVLKGKQSTGQKKRAMIDVYSILAMLLIVWAVGYLIVQMFDDFEKIKNWLKQIKDEW